jgi:ribonuclease Z
MSLRYQVLGQPGRDNALLAWVDTGQAVYRVLFDCGEECLREVAVAEIKAINAVFFSHFHVDHIAGFDSFFRHHYAPAPDPMPLFGPAGAAAILQHRFQGFTWNLVADWPGEFHVTEVTATGLTTRRFLTGESFARAHEVASEPFRRVLWDRAEVQVEACLLDHGTPCLAYLLREKPRQNIDLTSLSRLGLVPGPWLKIVKDEKVPGDATVEAGGQTWRVGDLRQRLLVGRPGSSLAYLTDFCLEGRAEEELVDMIRGCDVMICENNYRTRDRELARKNFHLVSEQVGHLAAQVKPGKLILFHLSDRYPREEWQELLMEVREWFAETYFPDGWIS